ncbi:MAG: MFS transporter [Proteobacteria bacterium]|nr:MFS transporter [Pseudomonadota bacterium]MBU1739609.1 MFS transporter [Pseudomonadota bacterium]
MTTRSCDSARPYLPVGDWRSYISLLQGNPAYRRFWSAGIISNLGNWLNYIAIFVLLSRLTGSGHAVGWFLIAKFIPTTIFGPAAGVIADRFSRKRIMILSDLLRVVIVLSFLVVKEPGQAWLIYLLAFIQESVWTFHDPARRASVPNLCRPEELNVANALGGATWSIMLAFGAALGGFITALFNWQTAIVIDAATFLLSALIMSTLVIPSPAREKRSTPGGFLHYTGLPDLLEGCRYVKGHHEVLPLLLVKSGWAISGGILVLLTWFGENVFTGFGEGSGSGILYSFRGIGAALGPILAWRILGESKPAMFRAIALSFYVASLAYILFSLAPTLLAAVPFVFLGHLGGSVQWVFSTNLLQRIVPDHFRGRVFAAEMALLTLILSLSTWFTGAALDSGMSPRIVALRLALLFLLPGSLWTLRLFLTRKRRENENR